MFNRSLALGVEYWVLDVGCWALGFGLWVFGVGRCVLRDEGFGLYFS